jgi:putative ABC transport system permease protein
MLKLVDIRKTYLAGSDKIEALKGISLAFRKNEFVSILGPSGCGKTTLLNIIGGLDHFTGGNLFIEGRSTKLFRDKDWDAYRNQKVGFVFQNYHLIPHQNVFKNVEMSLSLSGVKPKERKMRVAAALAAVGLAEQMNKRPNQLSGGQMQRVSIARALVNNPDIILADEPTGALDSETSIQIMELLEKISKEKLVIMVTHNAELANRYSTRIIRLLDGRKVDDTHPYSEGQDILAEAVPEEATTADLGSPFVIQIYGRDAAVNTVRASFAPCQIKHKDPSEKSPALRSHGTKSEKQRRRQEKTSMSFWTALGLSFSNLRTKKVRTTITAIGGSIGIIGVGLVLAISNGFSAYIERMEATSLSSFPIMVSETTYDQAALLEMSSYVTATKDSGTLQAFPTDGRVTAKEATIGKGNSIEDMMASLKQLIIKNELTDAYFDYLSGLNPSLGYVHFIYDLDMNIINKTGENQYKVAGRSSIGWQQLLGGKEFVLKQYDIIGGRFPENAFETVIFVDKYNRIESTILTSLGIDYTRTDITIDELMVSDRLKYAENDAYYKNNGHDVFSRVSDLRTIYESEKSHTLNIVGVLRVKPGVDYEMMSTGIAYTQDLVEFAFRTGYESEIVLTQKRLLEEAILRYEEEKARNEAQGIRSDKDMELMNVLTGRPFTPSETELMMQALMGITAPKVEVLCQNQLKKLGGNKTPVSAYIFPAGYKQKEEIKAYLNAYNKDKSKNERIVYTDMAETATSMAGEIVNIITIVLSCFAGISLVVSSVMIGIITYVSVVERTQEIGILRSIGARKVDVFRVFNAETTIIGFVAGTIGIILTYILSIPINMIIKHYAGIEANIAALLPYNALLLIAISIMLTFLAGLIPSAIAARRDPVLALRSE